jgi:hypothetical protein
MYGGRSVLVQVGLSYILDHDEHVSRENLQLLSDALTKFVDGTGSLPQTADIFRATLGSSKPFDRVVSIVQTTENPIPDFSGLAQQKHSPRKITRSWTEYENQRLIAGICRYGTDNWLAVAAFVGNGRTRAQCAQRWIRGLDPRISKDRWTAESEGRLQELVERFGTKSWSRIASEMGNRSDVQCRYHYYQMNQEKAQKNLTISHCASFPVGLLMQKNGAKPERKMFPPIENLLKSDVPWRASESMGVLPVLPGHQNRLPMSD